MLVSRRTRWGGVDIIEAMEEISRADGSTGWAFMANSIDLWAASGFLPEEGARTLQWRSQGHYSGILRAGVPCRRGGPWGSGRLRLGSGPAYATWIGCGI